jgi:hypothetical protein
MNPITSKIPTEEIILSNNKIIPSIPTLNIKINKNRPLPSIPTFLDLIPSDIRKLIANDLSQKDLKNLSQTSYKWNKFLWENLDSQIPLLFEKLNFEMKHYYDSKFTELYLRYDCRVLNDCQVRYNFNKLKEDKGFLGIGPSSQTLLEIVKIEACSDLAVAKETANNIRCTRRRAEAFIEIAKVDPSPSFDEIDTAFSKMNEEAENEDIREEKRVMRHEVFKLELLTNFDQVKASVLNTYHNSLTYPELIETSDLSLLEVVKVECLFNPKEAKLTANMIQDELIRIDALIVIAQCEGSPNFDEIKTKAQLIESPEKRYRAFLHIERALLEKVTAECLCDLNHATMTAQQIEENLALKGLALLEIEKAKPCPNMDEIKAILIGLDDSPEKNELLMKYIKLEALSNIDSAFAMVMQNRCPKFQLQAIREIVKTKALVNIQGAKAFAYTIPKHLQEAAFFEIVKIEAEQGVNATKTSIKEIRQPGELKVKAYMSLAEFALKKLGF